MCSGEAHSLWAAAADGSARYAGRCKPERIGNVVLPPDAGTCLDKGVEPNTKPITTGLVPGTITVGGAEEEACVLDPCMGLSGDPDLPPSTEEYEGNWNPDKGRCDCRESSGFFNMDVKAHNAKFPDNPIPDNPVGHVCYEACTPGARALCEVSAGNQCVPDTTERLGYMCNCTVPGFANPRVDPGGDERNMEVCEACLNGHQEFEDCSALTCCNDKYRCFSGSDHYYSCDNQRGYMKTWSCTKHNVC